jgi:hypothetical protein
MGNLFVLEWVQGRFVVLQHILLETRGRLGDFSVLKGVFTGFY